MAGPAARTRPANNDAPLTCGLVTEQSQLGRNGGAQKATGALNHIKIDDRYGVACDGGCACAVAQECAVAAPSLLAAVISRHVPCHAEIEKHTGIAEKTLSEFVLALSKQSKSVKDFKKQLDTNGAEFPESLVHTLWNVIQALQVCAAGNQARDAWHMQADIAAAHVRACSTGAVQTNAVLMSSQPKANGAAKAANGSGPTVSSRDGEFQGLTIEDTRDRARRLQQVLLPCLLSVHHATERTESLASCCCSATI